MIKRLSKSKRNKQGAILVLVVLILALAMIFIASAMMLTQATRSRLYENTMSSQARLTVSAAAETFLEALQTQEITDKQMDAMLAECSTRQTDNSKKIKMVVSGVPGMSNAPDNCTYLDIYYPDATNTTKVYCDFTTVIGDQTENVRVILVVEDPNTNNTGRFKNQIDIGGDVGTEQLRFTRGVGMTSAAKRAENITDNTILLRAGAYEQASSSIVYSDVVYAPGSVATWGGGNTFNGNMIFLDGAYLSSYSSGTAFNGDFYFVGGSDNKAGLTSGGTDDGWSAPPQNPGDPINWGNFNENNSFYFYKRTAQNETSTDQNHKVQFTLQHHDCYFVGVNSDNFNADGDLKGISKGSDYYITNKGAFPGSTTDLSTPAGRMEVYKTYDYNPSSEPFPTNCTEDVLSEINLSGTTVLTEDKTFDYVNYDTAGNTYYPGTEISAGTEILKNPITPTYPEYKKITQGGSKIIDPDRTFDIGSLDSYDGDANTRIIDLDDGGAYYFTPGTTMSDNGNRKPYVFAIDGNKSTILYFASGEYYFNCCCFALYNVSDTMKPVIIIMEDGAEFYLAKDSSYQVGDDYFCSAGFISLGRGFTSASGIAGYIQSHGHNSENVSWTQANGDEVSYPSYYDGNVRPNIYIYGVKNNKIIFGNDNIIEAYIGLYDDPTSGSGFYSASNGAKAYIYGRLEGMRISNGSSDAYCMPYCPAPANTNSQPDQRVAVTKYKVSNIIYYYGTLDSESEGEGA